jgi:hypothetical protein
MKAQDFPFSIYHFSFCHLWNQASEVRLEAPLNERRARLFTNKNEKWKMVNGKW